MYLVCGRKIGRMGATDRPRPYSIKKTHKRSRLLLAPLPFTTKRREPEQLPGPLPPNTSGARISATTGLQHQRRSKLLEHTQRVQSGFWRVLTSARIAWRRLLTMERSRKPPKAGGSRRRLWSSLTRRQSAIDALLSLSASEGAYPVLVILLEATTGGLERTVGKGLWPRKGIASSSSGGQSPSGG